MVVQLIKFGFFGIIATAIDYFIFVILIRLEFYYLFANLLAFLVASVIGYALSIRFVWGHNSTWKYFFMYYLIQIAGLLSTSLLLFFMRDLISTEMAKLIAICLVPMQTFLLNKFLVFR